MLGHPLSHRLITPTLPKDYPVGVEPTNTRVAVSHPAAEYRIDKGNWLAKPSMNPTVTMPSFLSMDCHSLYG